MYYIKILKLKIIGSTTTYTDNKNNKSFTGGLRTYRVDSTWFMDFGVHIIIKSNAESFFCDCDG